MSDVLAKEKNLKTIELISDTLLLLIDEITELKKAVNACRTDVDTYQEHFALLARSQGHLEKKLNELMKNQ